MRILVIEDNPKLVRSITKGLQQEGYATDALTNGIDGEKRILLNQHDYDVVILDVMLPGKNGVEVCKSLRALGVMIPIIMLTAQGAVEDKITGLDSGADDYMAKPFSLNELLSRVRALARRQRSAHAPLLHVGNLTLNPAAQEVFVGDAKLMLTLKEFRMLEFFMIHPGQVLSRQTLVDHLWDFHFNPLSRVMDVHINNLRNKLIENHGTTIETVRGIGYRLHS